MAGLSALCALGGVALLVGGAPGAGLGVVLAGYLGTGVLHVRGARRRQAQQAQEEAELRAQARAAAAAELEAQRREHVDQERRLADQALALEVKNQELSRLSEAKSQFLAAVSHELRTPLNAIIGFADLLLEGAAGTMTESQAEYLSDIRSSGTHLLRIINDILDYSKLEAGRLALTQERVDFGEVVAEAVRMLEGTARKKGLTLSRELEAGVTVMGDPLRLKQVVLNLVANAVKFTPTGGSVAVRLSTDVGAVLTVRDTGIGIAPEHQAAIFEPFTQVEGHESRRFEGTGLGLSLVKRLLEPMGGTVRVESLEGQGATFTVELPRETSRVVLAPVRTDRRPDVLIADDDDATRFMLCRMLNASSCEARGASNGQRAVEALAERLPDVLVLDLMMPELDGFGVLERLRALPGGGEVRVLVFSATEPTSHERNELERRGAQVLVKGTVGTQAVIAAVQQLAGLSSPRSAA